MLLILEFKILPRAGATVLKPLKPELSSEAGNDPSDTAPQPLRAGKDLEELVPYPEGL